MDKEKLKRMLADEKAQEGAVLATAGGAMLLYTIVSHCTGGFGGWQTSPYLFLAGAAAALLALALRILWQGLRNDPLDDNYIYPDEVYLDEATLDGVDVDGLFDGEQGDEVTQNPETERDETEEPKAKPLIIIKNGIVLAVIGITVVYCLIMPSLGFILSTMLYLAALLVLAGEHRWTVVALVSVLTSSTVYLLFEVLLGVMLP